MSKEDREHVISLRNWLQRHSEDHDGDLATKLLELFSGGPSIHAEQWRGPNRTSGYANKPGAIDRELILRHLKGSCSVGILGPASDDMLLQNCLIIHGKNRFSKRSASDEDREATLRGALVARSQLTDLGVDSLCVCHDGRTFALWIFYEAPIKASFSRGAIFKFLAGRAIHRKEGISAVGVFPLTSYSGRVHLVPPAPLPFGRDRLTGLRSYAVDENGQRIENNLEELNRIKRTPFSVIEKLYAKLSPEAEKAIDAIFERHHRDRSARLLQLDRCHNAHLRLVDD